MSIIVVDNASYHCTTINKVPNTGPSKKDIQECLQKNCNAYDPTETIHELLLRVALYRSREKACELDQVADEMEIRLPPYHGQYNPSELVWHNSRNSTKLFDWRMLRDL